MYFRYKLTVFHDLFGRFTLACSFNNKIAESPDSFCNHCELEKVNTWLKLNKLSINVNKTKCMFFTKHRHLTPLQLLMNNKSIDVVQHFNYLGIMLDENMSWKTHIAMVRNKLSRINGIMHRLKYYFPQNILITLYKSLFTPHINYGSLLWGQAGENLDKIQKKNIITIH